jgi:hypothetical protein
MAIYQSKYTGKQIDEAVANQKVMAEQIEKNHQIAIRNSKQIENFKQGWSDQFETDLSVAYVKNVPENALPYAEIKKIGGMTYKDGNTLKSAKVTEVESVGANLFDIDKREFGTIDSNGDLYLANQLFDFYRFEAEENTQYTLSAYVKNMNTTGNGRFAVFYTDGSSDNTVLLNKETDWAYCSFTTAAGKTVETIRNYFGDSGAWVIKGGELMINKGSTALPYRPYVKHTLPIPTEVQALDGYGWGVDESIYNYIDWEKKQFVKRVGCVDMGTLNWSLNTSSVPTVYYTRNVSDIKLAPSYSARNTGILCAKYESVSSNTLTMPDKTIMRDQTSAVVYVSDNNYSNDTNSLKASLAGEMLYYELATPIITDISDLLPEDNFIGVEGNGTLTFKNEYEYAVPSEVEYQVEV